MNDLFVRSVLESTCSRLSRHTKVNDIYQSKLLALWKKGAWISDGELLAEVVGAVVRHAPSDVPEEQLVRLCSSLGAEPLVQSLVRCARAGS